MGGWLVDDAFTTFSIIFGLSGGLLSDAHSNMKIMLSSVVVEHCCLLGIECWRKFTIGWVWYITGDGSLEVLLYLLVIYEGQYLSIRGGCTPLNPRIIKGRLPLAISQNRKKGGMYIINNMIVV